MIKNTYAAACGNERRQHEKVFQRNMRRTGDAFDPVHPIDGGGAHGGAGLRHHALCGTGGHGGALLYVRQEQPETLQPGDTIAYVTDSDLSLEGGVIGSVDTERRFFYVEGAPVYWDNVLGQPLWGIDGLGYVSGYISRPPGLYLVLGAAGVAVHLPPATPKGRENGRIPHREMHSNECGRENSHRIGAGCGDGGGSPHLNGKACVCGGI